MGTVSRLDRIIDRFNSPKEVKPKQGRLVRLLQKIWNTVKGLLRRVFSTQNGLKKLDQRRIQKLSIDEIKFLSRSQLSALNLHLMSDAQILDLTPNMLLRIRGTNALEGIVHRLSSDQLKLLLKKKALTPEKAAPLLDDNQIRELVFEAARQRSPIALQIPTLLQHLSDEQRQNLWTASNAQVRAFCYQHLPEETRHLIRQLPQNELRSFVLQETDMDFVEVLPAPRLSQLLDCSALMQACSAEQLQGYIRDADHEKFIYLLKTLKKEKLKALAPYFNAQSIDRILSEQDKLDRVEIHTLIDVLMNEESTRIMTAEKFATAWPPRDFADAFARFFPLPLKLPLQTERFVASKVKDPSKLPEEWIRHIFEWPTANYFVKVDIFNKIIGTNKDTTLCALTGNLRKEEILPFLRRVIVTLTPNKMRQFFGDFDFTLEPSHEDITARNNAFYALPFICSDMAFVSNYILDLLPYLNPKQIAYLVNQNKITNSNVYTFCKRLLDPHNALWEEQLEVILTSFPHSIIPFFLQAEKIPNCAFSLLLNSPTPFSEIYPLIERDALQRRMPVEKRVEEILLEEERKERLFPIFEWLIEKKYTGFALLTGPFLKLDDQQQIQLFAKLADQFRIDIDHLEEKERQLPDTLGSYGSKQMAILDDIKNHTFPRVESFAALLALGRFCVKEQKELTQLKERMQTPLESNLWEDFIEREDLFGYLEGAGVCLQASNTNIKEKLGITDISILGRLGDEVRDLKELILESGESVYRTKDKPAIVIEKLKQYLKEQGHAD